MQKDVKPFYYNKNVGKKLQFQFQEVMATGNYREKKIRAWVGEKEKGGCLKCLVFFNTFPDKFCHFSKKGKRKNLAIYV